MQFLSWILRPINTLNTTDSTWKPCSERNQSYLYCILKSGELKPIAWGLAGCLQRSRTTTCWPCPVPPTLQAAFCCFFSFFLFWRWTLKGLTPEFTTCVCVCSLCQYLQMICMCLKTTPKQTKSNVTSDLVLPS